MQLRMFEGLHRKNFKRGTEKGTENFFKKMRTLNTIFQIHKWRKQCGIGGLSEALRYFLRARLFQVGETPYLKR